MKIVPSTHRDYAYVVWEKEEEEKIKELRDSMSPDGSDIPLLK